MTSTVKDRATGKYREIAPRTGRVPKKSISDVYAQAVVIGDNLRMLIAFHRDTQQELAAYLGISDRCLRDRLCRPWEWRLSELEDLARRYEVTVRQLAEPLITER